MRKLAVLFALLAGCNGGKPTPPAPPPPSGATVTVGGESVRVAHLLRDPDRRYPRGPGMMSSWDRDRYLHFFSDTPPQSQVCFLDQAGKILEIRTLHGYSDTGITSETEARHALFVAKSNAKVGDIVTFSSQISEGRPAPMHVVKIDGHAVYVETSNTLAQRMRGLMHRPRMSKDDGMLFLYPHEDDRSFWMKNTLMNLDIAYFSEDGRLLNVCRMKAAANPAEGGELKAPSAAPARFVLEVNYGWFDARGLIDAEGKPAKPVRIELSDSLRRLADEAE